VISGAVGRVGHAAAGSDDEGARLVEHSACGVVVDGHDDVGGCGVAFVREHDVLGGVGVGDRAVVDGHAERRVVQDHIGSAGHSGLVGDRGHHGGRRDRSGGRLRRRSGAGAIVGAGNVRLDRLRLSEAFHEDRASSKGLIHASYVLGETTNERRVWRGASGVAVQTVRERGARATARRLGRDEAKDGIRAKGFIGIATTSRRSAIRRPLAHSLRISKAIGVGEGAHARYARYRGSNDRKKSGDENYTNKTTASNRRHDEDCNASETGSSQNSQPILGDPSHITRTRLRDPLTAKVPKKCDTIEGS